MSKEQEVEQNTEIVSKKKLGLLPKIFIFLFLIIFLCFGYMHFIEPKLLIVHEYPVINEKIPDSFNGFKIVQFSDIHFGRTTNEQEVERVVNKINELKPDILVFTGDLFDPYITLSENHIRFLTEVLSKTTAKLGKYAIYGDNDYLNEEAFSNIFTTAGFTILDNTNLPIYYEGTTPIYLSGIPSVSKGNQDITKALTKEEQNIYQILLMHEPVLFDEVKNETDLVLAGHTLGGLVQIPFIGGIFSLENTGEYESGIYQKGNAVMYVSNGIGTQNFSLRLGNIPSVSLYRLYNYQ